ncbi:MAG: thioredoxin fold domain-containing protein [Crocinitomicaceae bacterium]|nr:thioredoxin fold domain-containing protein [Crocinitomicaceae bacterium]
MTLRLFFLSIAMMASTSGFASDTTLIFRQLSYSKLFDTAKEENKIVMLYFHFDGCGACFQMEKTVFSDPEVARFYNSNFINFEVNTLKEKGIEVNKVYSIKMHPTYLFLDQSGNELHRIVGVFSPEEFLEQARHIITNGKVLSDYKKQYAAGNRDSDFLFAYCYMLRDAFELDSSIVMDYLNTVEPHDLSEEKNLKFIYEFCVHNSQTFIPFDSPYFSFLKQNKEKFYVYLEKDQVTARIARIINEACYIAIEHKDEPAFKKAIQALEEYDTGEPYLFKETDGRITGIMGIHLVLQTSLAFYDRIGNTVHYNKTLESYISKIWDDENSLNFYAWEVVNSQANAGETNKIKTAIKCSIRSIELNNNYANNDTYAWLLYKSGDQQKALTQAEKTIEIAKKNNENYTETQKLVDLIKTGK